MPQTEHRCHKMHKSLAITFQPGPHGEGWTLADTSDWWFVAIIFCPWCRTWLAGIK